MGEITIIMKAKKLEVSTSEEASKKLIELKPQIACVEFPLNLDLEIKLERGIDVDIVTLKSGKRTGVTPRNTSDHNYGVTVSTSEGEDNPYLCLHVVDNYLHPFLDRGLCFVHSGRPAKITLVFRNLDRELLNTKEISSLIDRAEEKAMKVINQVLAGCGAKLTRTCQKETADLITKAFNEFLQNYSRKRLDEISQGLGEKRNLDEVLQSFRENRIDEKLQESFKQQLLSVPKREVAAFFSEKIYDLFAERISPNIFATIVNLIASESDVDAFRDGLNCVWYEARWIPAVGISMAGGEKAIDMMLEELRNLENAAKEFETEKYGHWALAYQEILVEALVLIRPKNYKERILIIQGLEEVAKMSSLVRARSLAQFILDEKKLPENTDHNSLEHRIFLKYVKTRIRRYDYTFATEDDSRKILALEPKS